MQAGRRSRKRLASREARTGLWARYRPEELATPEAFARDPALVWRWYRWRADLVRRAEPHAGHRARARLEALVPRLTLITRNVDGLHQRAGSRRVLELHASLLRARCSTEGTVLAEWDDSAPVPACARCGAPLRPEVVWFGEPLPPALLAETRAAAVAVINPIMEGQRAGPGIYHLVGAAGEVVPALIAAAWPEAPPPHPFAGRGA